MISVSGFEIAELKQTYDLDGKLVILHGSPLPNTTNSPYLWFPLFDYFNGGIKVNFCHLGSFTLAAVHLVKVIQESVCELLPPLTFNCLAY